MEYLPITASYINDVMLCARLYSYNRIRNLRLPNMPVFVDRGTYLHSLLESYYRGIMYNYSGAEPSIAISDLVNISIEENRIKALGPDMNLDPSDIADTEFQFREYVDHYKGDGLIPVAVEEPFSKPLFVSEEHQITVLLEGRFDLIGRVVTQPDTTIIYDHKSVSRRKDPNVLMNQALAYAWATGIRTFCLNEVGFQKTVSRPDRFHRHVWRYNPEQITEWEHVAIFWIKQLLDYIAEGIFPPNFTSCDKFGYVGGGGCRFREVCAAIPSARESRIRSKFIEGPAHDPYVKG